MKKISLILLALVLCISILSIPAFAAIEGVQIMAEETNTTSPEDTETDGTETEGTETDDTTTDGAEADDTTTDGAETEGEETTPTTANNQKKEKEAESMVTEFLGIPMLKKTKTLIILGIALVVIIAVAAVLSIPKKIN